MADVTREELYARQLRTLDAKGGETLVRKEEANRCTVEKVRNLEDGWILVKKTWAGGPTCPFPRGTVSFSSERAKDYDTGTTTVVSDGGVLTRG